MENASKALIMAGTILVSIVLLSLMVILIRNGGMVSQQYDNKLSDDELNAYNAKFEKFVTVEKGLHSTDASNTYKGSYILPSDIVTLVNRAYDVNSKDVEIDYVTIYIEIPDTEHPDNNPTEYVFDASIKDNSILAKKNKGNGTIAKNEFLEKYSETVYKKANMSYYYMNKDTVDGLDYIYKFQCSVTKYSEITGKVIEMRIKYIK